MIASLRGELAFIGKDAVVVDVNGVGYLVQLSQRHLTELPGLGDSVRLFTHLIHREDAMLLVGFPSLDERELFLLLNSVSGVGAKTALGVLSALTVSEVVTAVVGQNPARLAKAPGVGKKTAERIVLELREKLQAWQPRQAAEAGAAARRRPVVLEEANEAEAALMALGYTEEEIDEALDHVPAGSGVEDTLRQALAYLAGF